MESQAQGRVALGADHAGVGLKAEVATFLRERGFEVEDLGTEGPASVHYPDFGRAVAHAVVEGRADFGVLVCGSGIGMSIAANKVRGVRAALCRTVYDAEMARAHNDANVLCLGERVTGVGLALRILEAWLQSSFEGGRHQLRLDRIRDIEEETEA